ncbi:hypothetical protein GCM10027174_25380 [Salinifilum aidingensis]
MVDVGYWEAWGLWWSGTKLEDFAMWGLPLLWWARIGKLLQFTGGAVVVLDLIGPERFTRFADWLAQFSSWFSRIRSAIRRKAYKKSKEKLKRVDTEAESLLLHKTWKAMLAWDALGILTLGPAYLAGLYFIVNSTGDDPLYQKIISYILALFWQWAVLAAYALFGQHLVQAVAAIIRLGKFRHAAQWAGFVLIVMGFHFDLLAS